MSAENIDIKSQLLSELSRINIDFTIHTLGDNKEHFRELINFIMTEPDPLPMRASWVIEGITLKYPSMIKPYLAILIKNLRKFTHQGTCRNLLKIFSRTEIPMKYHGILMDICFEWLQAESRSVAEKVFAMQIIANHIKFYPELTSEFLTILNNETPKNSAGFSSRAKKIKKDLKILEK